MRHTHTQNHQGFKVDEFLTILHQYTQVQSDLDGVLDCLRMWASVVQHVSDTVTSASDPASPSATAEQVAREQAYCSALCALAAHLLDRVLFSRSAKALAALSDDLPEATSNGGGGASASGSASNHKYSSAAVFGTQSHTTNTLLRGGLLLC